MPHRSILSWGTQRVGRERWLFEILSGATLLDFRDNVHQTDLCFPYFVFSSVFVFTARRATPKCIVMEKRLCGVEKKLHKILLRRDLLDPLQEKSITSPTSPHSFPVSVRRLGTTSTCNMHVALGRRRRTNAQKHATLRRRIYQELGDGGGRCRRFYFEEIGRKTNDGADGAGIFLQYSISSGLIDILQASVALLRRQD